MAGYLSSCYRNHFHTSRNDIKLLNTVTKGLWSRTPCVPPWTYPCRDSIGIT